MKKLNYTFWDSTEMYDVADGSLPTNVAHQRTTPHVAPQTTAGSGNRILAPDEGGTGFGGFGEGGYAKEACPPGHFNWFGKCKPIQRYSAGKNIWPMVSLALLAVFVVGAIYFVRKGGE